MWRGQGAHHGRALLARGAEPVLPRRELSGDAEDHEARYIEAEGDNIAGANASGAHLLF